MKSRSLTFWLTSYLGAAWLTMLLALGLILWQSVHQVMAQAQADKSQALAAQLAAVAVDAVLLRDYGSLERSVSDMVKAGGQAYVEIRRADGEVLAHAGQPATDLPLQHAPLIAAGETLGEVSLQYDSTLARAAAWRIAGLLAAGLGIFSLFAFFGLRRLLVARLITPVRALLDHTDLEHPHSASADTPVEVHELAAALAGLQARVAEHVAALDEAAQARNEALRRLCGEQRLATVGQLAGEVAHELNTPLANILCYAQMELPRVTDEDSRQALETIVAQARRAGLIVRDMLTVARAPAVHSEILNLDELAATFVRLLAPLARRQEAQVVLDAAGKTPVLADASRLEQILFNLATNALQAGAKLIEVHVTSTPPCVTVRDDGPGVDAMVRERLFDPFVTSKPTGQGTGLGLAICKRLAEEMGGHLSLLVSQPGQTEFQLQLPSPRSEP